MMRLLLCLVLVVFFLSGTHQGAGDSSPSLKQKISQLLIVGIKFNKDISLYKTLLKKEKIGGVLVLGTEKLTFSQVKRDIQQLKDWRGSGPAPLLIGIDQEGGRVRRLRSGIGWYPGNLALGAIGSSHLIERVAWSTGKSLVDLGVNFNFAPVLDVDRTMKNPVMDRRCFSDNPETVSILGQAFIEGLTTSGIKPVGKHFPGHGGVLLDSHLELPVNTNSKKHIFKTDLVPFIDAINANIRYLMTSHVLYTHLDSENAATFSKKILTDLLRHDLGFSGVVMTDDLAMGAAKEFGNLSTRLIRALKAGADLIIVSSPWYEVESMLKSVIEKAYKDSELRQSIERSYSRVIAEALSPSYPKRSAELSGLESEIRRKSITIFRNKNNVIPMDKNVSELFVISKIEDIEKSKNKTNKIGLLVGPIHLLNDMQDFDGIVIGYHRTKAIINAALKVISGEEKALGILPATL